MRSQFIFVRYFELLLLLLVVAVSGHLMLSTSRVALVIPTAIWLQGYKPITGSRRIFESQRRSLKLYGSLRHALFVRGSTTASIYDYSTINQVLLRHSAQLYDFTISNNLSIVYVKNSAAVRNVTKWNQTTL